MIVTLTERPGPTPEQTRRVRRHQEHRRELAKRHGTTVAGLSKLLDAPGDRLRRAHRMALSSAEPPPFRPGDVAPSAEPMAPNALRDAARRAHEAYQAEREKREKDGGKK